MLACVSMKPQFLMIRTFPRKVTLRTSLFVHKAETQSRHPFQYRLVLYESGAVCQADLRPSICSFRLPMKRYDPNRTHSRFRRKVYCVAV